MFEKARYNFFVEVLITIKNNKELLFLWVN